MGCGSSSSRKSSHKPTSMAQPATVGPARRTQKSTVKNTPPSTCWRPCVETGRSRLRDARGYPSFDAPKPLLERRLHGHLYITDDRPIIGFLNGWDSFATERRSSFFQAAVFERAGIVKSTSSSGAAGAPSKLAGLKTPCSQPGLAEIVG